MGAQKEIHRKCRSHGPGTAFYYYLNSLLHFCMCVRLPRLRKLWTNSQGGIHPMYTFLVYISYICERCKSVSFTYMPDLIRLEIKEGFLSQTMAFQCTNLFLSLCPYLIISPYLLQSNFIWFQRSLLFHLK